MGNTPPRYSGQVHLEQAVKDKWEMFQGHFEYYVSEDPSGVCIRKLEGERWPIAIELKMLLGGKEWIIQCRTLDKWNPPLEGPTTSQHEWHIGTALYECDRFSKNCFARINGNASIFARDVAAQMKRNGPRDLLLKPVDSETNLLTWAKEADINLHLCSMLQ